MSNTNTAQAISIGGNKPGSRSAMAIGRCQWLAIVEGSLNNNMTTRIIIRGKVPVTALNAIVPHTNAYAGSISACPYPLKTLESRAGKAKSACHRKVPLS
jgi:hypothetical protein